MLLLALLFVVACTGSADEPATTSVDDPLPTTTVSDDGTPDPEPTSTTVPGPTTTLSDRPLAPDFTLELADGGEYTLSAGAKPVYLVFWAEW